jgi:hypothetical protein
MIPLCRTIITSVKKDPVGLTQSLPFLCILTLFIELLVCFIYIKITKKPARILVWVIVANIITLPIVWYLIPWLISLVLPSTGLTTALQIIISELFVVIFEGYFICFTNTTSMSLIYAIVMSFFMNVSSFLLGFGFGSGIIP